MVYEHNESETLTTPSLSEVCDTETMPKLAAYASDSLVEVISGKSQQYNVRILSHMCAVVPFWFVLFLNKVILRYRIKKVSIAIYETSCCWPSQANSVNKAPFVSSNPFTINITINK